MENKSPLVSVCIPTYNRPEGLRRTLECITRQTYKNSEIIISDNCSPGPETESCAREFMKKDTRVQYFRQKRNMGATFNFKFVLEKATGEYFMWAADDDEWKDTYVEKCLEKFLKNDKLVLCYSEAIIRNFRGQSEFLWPSDMVTVGLKKEKGIQKILFNQHRNTEFYGLMKANIAKKYRIKNRLGEDHVFVLYLVLNGEIDKTDAGLFISGVGSTGYSSESIVRSLRLNN